MKNTTAKVVPKNARPGTTFLATTSATLMGNYPVSPAGRENTAKNLSVLKDAAKAMETVPVRENACVGQAGRASSVMSVSVIQAVNMAHASYPGSVTVKKAGEDCSVTRILTTVLITGHA